MGNVQNSLLFQPPLNTNLHPSARFWLTTKTKSRIPAVFIKRPRANVTILFSHGNAEDLETAYDWLWSLVRYLKVNILAYDYTGYGGSDGSPSEQNCYHDIEAAYDFLINDQQIPPEQIVLYGRSLGSGPSCYLASKLAKQGGLLAGLILHSPFTSVYRVIVNLGGPTMIGDKFPNIDRMPSVKCPVLIVHGTDDEIVPFEHGNLLINKGALFRAIPDKTKGETFWIGGMGHNDIDRQTEQAMMNRINGFLDFHVLSRRLWAQHPPSKYCSRSYAGKEVIWRHPKKRGDERRKRQCKKGHGF